MPSDDFRITNEFTKITRGEGTSATHSQTVTYNDVKDVATRVPAGPLVTTIVDEQINITGKSTYVDAPPSILLQFEFEIDGAGLG